MNYSIEHTYTTPLINLNKGNINIVGRSIPTVNFEFFNSFIDLIEIYSKDPELYTILNINLEYINAFSKRCILKSFKIFEKMHRRGYRISINWYYDKDDEFMYELGCIYNSLIELPINFVEKSTPT
jgi:hypothetical protein